MYLSDQLEKTEKTFEPGVSFSRFESRDVLLHNLTVIQSNAASYHLIHEMLVLINTREYLVDNSVCQTIKLYAESDRSTCTKKIW